MILLGIDPGLSGALAALDAHGLRDVADMPIMARGKGTGRVKSQVNPAGILELLRGWSDPRDSLLAVLEHVAAMPGQGVAGVFSLGDSYGCLRGGSTATRKGRGPGRWSFTLLHRFRANATTAEQKRSCLRVMAWSTSHERCIRHRVRPGRAHAALLASRRHELPGLRTASPSRRRTDRRSADPRVARAAVPARRVPFGRGHEREGRFFQIGPPRGAKSGEPIRHRLPAPVLAPLRMQG